MFVALALLAFIGAATKSLTAESVADSCPLAANCFASGATIDGATACFSSLDPKRHYGDYVEVPWTRSLALKGQKWEIGAATPTKADSNVAFQVPCPFNRSLKVTIMCPVSQGPLQGCESSDPMYVELLLAEDATVTPTANRFLWALSTKSPLKVGSRVWHVVLGASGEPTSEATQAEDFVREHLRQISDGDKVAINSLRHSFREEVLGGKGPPLSLDAVVKTLLGERVLEKSKSEQRLTRQESSILEAAVQKLKDTPPTFSLMDEPRSALAIDSEPELIRVSPIAEDADGPRRQLRSSSTGTMEGAKKKPRRFWGKIRHRDPSGVKRPPVGQDAGVQPLVAFKRRKKRRAPLPPVKPSVPRFQLPGDSSYPKLDKTKPRLKFAPPLKSILRRRQKEDVSSPVAPGVPMAPPPSGVPVAPPPPPSGVPVAPPPPPRGVPVAPPPPFSGVPVAPPPPPPRIPIALPYRSSERNLPVKTQPQKPAGDLMAELNAALKSRSSNTPSRVVVKQLPKTPREQFNDDLQKRLAAQRRARAEDEEDDWETPAVVPARSTPPPQPAAKPRPVNLPDLRDKSAHMPRDVYFNELKQAAAKFKARQGQVADF